MNADNKRESYDIWALFEELISDDSWEADPKKRQILVNALFRALK